jgi:hypothetical protein
MADNGMFILALHPVLCQDQHQQQQDRLQHQGMDLNQDHLSAKPGYPSAEQAPEQAPDPGHPL